MKKLILIFLIFFGFLFSAYAIDRKEKMGLGFTLGGPNLGFGIRGNYYPYSMLDLAGGIGVARLFTAFKAYSVNAELLLHALETYRASPYFILATGYFWGKDVETEEGFSGDVGFTKYHPKEVSSVFFSPGVGFQWLAESGFSLFIEYNYMMSKESYHSFGGIGIQVFN